MQHVCRLLEGRRLAGWKAQALRIVQLAITSSHDQRRADAQLPF